MIKVKPTPFNIGWMIGLALVVFIGAPLAVIWALNTLFPVLNIPFGFDTWLAAYIIPAAFKTEINFNKKD